MFKSNKQSGYGYKLSTLLTYSCLSFCMSHNMEINPLDYPQVSMLDLPVDAGPSFGHSIATNGQVSIVGAFTQGGGAAYVYVREKNSYEESWVAIEKLGGNTSSKYRNFGESIDVYGNKIAISSVDYVEHIDVNETIFVEQVLVYLYKYRLKDTTENMLFETVDVIALTPKEASTEITVDSTSVCFIGDSLIVNVVWKDDRSDSPQYTMDTFMIPITEMTTTSRYSKNTEFEVKPKFMEESIQYLQSVAGGRGGALDGYENWLAIGNINGQMNSSNVLVSTGVVYIFHKNDNKKWTLYSTIQSSNAVPMSGEMFGCSLSFSRSNNLKLAIGSCGDKPGMPSKVGVYDYHSDTSIWALDSVLPNRHELGVRNGYGYHVTFFGDMSLLVSAPSSQYSDMSVGAVCRFTRNTTFNTWEWDAIYFANATEGYDSSMYFGVAVATSNGRTSHGQSQLSGDVSDVIMIGSSLLKHPFPPKKTGAVFLAYSYLLENYLDDDNDQNSKTSSMRLDATSIITMLGYVMLILVPMVALGASVIYVYQQRSKMMAQFESMDTSVSSMDTSTTTSDGHVAMTSTTDNSAPSSNDGDGKDQRFSNPLLQFSAAGMLSKIRAMRPHTYTSAGASDEVEEIQPKVHRKTTSHNKNPMFQPDVVV